MADEAGALEGAVIAFDLDGTLVDTAPDLVGTLNVLLAQEGVAPLPLAEARPFIGRGARWLIERGFSQAGAPLDAGRVPELFDRFIAHYLTHIADQSRPFPGVEAALDRLKAMGAKLCVCTNKRTDLSVALLEAVGLAGRFDAVIGADAAPDATGVESGARAYDAGPVARSRPVPRTERLQLSNDDLAPWAASGVVLEFDPGRWPRRDQGCVIDLIGGQRLVRLYDRADGERLYLRGGPGGLAVETALERALAQRVAAVVARLDP